MPPPPPHASWLLAGGHDPVSEALRIAAAHERAIDSARTRIVARLEAPAHEFGSNGVPRPVRVLPHDEVVAR